VQWLVQWENLLITQKGCEVSFTSSGRSTLPFVGQFPQVLEQKGFANLWKSPICKSWNEQLFIFKLSCDENYWTKPLAAEACWAAINVFQYSPFMRF
jgi:hypothetical protein